MSKVIAFLSIVIVSTCLRAQPPQKMSYQAVVRNASGELIRQQQIGMRISILQGSTEGYQVYSEAQTLFTNVNGLVTIEIGGGSGFSQIDWSDGPYFIKIETDLSGATDYSIVGVTQLLSVPYAYHAEKASSFMGLGDLIIPVMTPTEILEIEPEVGQTVYNSDEKIIQIYDGTNWGSFTINCWPQPTAAKAGPNLHFTDDRATVTLSANSPEPYHGTGQWSIISGEGGGFDDDTSPSTVFTGLECMSYKLRWKISTVCGSSTSNMSITFNHTPTKADAGPDQYYNDGTTSTTLAANTPTEGTAKWSIISGDGGSFDDDTKHDAEFTGQPCTSYQLRWTITTVCGTNSSDMSVSFNHLPTVADAGQDQFLTDGTTSTTLAANTPTEGTAKWSIISGDGGSFDDDTKHDAIFTGNLYEIYHLQWEVTTICEVSADQIILFFGINGPGPILSDIDGNKYNTTWIGSQLWMAENLKTTHYNNGVPIEFPGSHNSEWQFNDSGAYAIYDISYGALYNGYAVSNENGLCPIGWRVPSDNEWTILIEYLSGGEQSGGKQLKSCRQVNSILGGECSTSTHPRWNSHSTVFGSDDYGFSAYPGGYRLGNGNYFSLGDRGYWWSSTEYLVGYKWARQLIYNDSKIYRYDSPNANGNSVRCLRDN